MQRGSKESRWSQIKRGDIILACVFYVLNLVDTAMTVKALSLPDFYEFNPLMAALQRLGMGYFIAFKIIFVFFLTLLMLVYQPPKKINLALLVATVIFILITISNTLMLLLHAP